jgi:hypothetical protein
MNTPTRPNDISRCSADRLCILRLPFGTSDPVDTPDCVELMDPVDTPDCVELIVVLMDPVDPSDCVELMVELMVKLMVELMVELMVALVRQSAIDIPPPACVPVTRPS